MIDMITLEDCIGLCGLTEEEVLAIAEHEHLPEIAATALAQYLLSHKHGSEEIRDMIVDDIRQAQLGSDKEHALTLLHVLHHFLKTHPEATPSQHPWSKRFAGPLCYAARQAFRKGLWLDIIGKTQTPKHTDN